MEILVGAYESLLYEVFGVVPSRAHLIGKSKYERSMSLE